MHARISGACLDAAMGLVPSLTIKGTQHPTNDGTCVRDYIHVSDLVAAHLSAMQAVANPPALFNVGTGKGVSVREFVTACRKVTGVDIQVTFSWHIISSCTDGVLHISHDWEAGQQFPCKMHPHR